MSTRSTDIRRYIPAPVLQTLFPYYLETDLAAADQTAHDEIASLRLVGRLERESLAEGPQSCLSSDAVSSTRPSPPPTPRNRHFGAERQPEEESSEVPDPPMVNDKPDHRVFR